MQRDRVSGAKYQARNMILSKQLSEHKNYDIIWFMVLSDQNKQNNAIGFSGFKPTHSFGNNSVHPTLSTALFIVTLGRPRPPLSYRMTYRNAAIRCFCTILNNAAYGFRSLISKFSISTCLMKLPDFTG
jgi:hypothetical protein